MLATGRFQGELPKVPAEIGPLVAGGAVVVVVVEVVAGGEVVVVVAAVTVGLVDGVTVVGVCRLRRRNSPSAVAVPSTSFDAGAQPANTIAITMSVGMNRRM